MKAKHQRQQTMIDARRALVLNAARAVVAEVGMEGANIRDIAKRAGYTPGAIYSYFDSKEAIFGALLAESLERLNVAMGQARVVRNKPEKTLLAKSLAWFGFYANNPRDLDLGFYLLQGMRPRASTNESNSPVAPRLEIIRFTERLLDAALPGKTALLEMGLSPVQAMRESTALFAHGVGLLLLQRTGGLGTLGPSAEALFKLYLEQLIARCGGTMEMLQTEGAEPTSPAQVSLFE